MSIQITLTPDEERKFAELAHARGKNPADHASEVVSAYLNGADQSGTKSFEEILAPVWEGWRRSGLSDEEIDELLEGELREVRAQRRQAKGAP